MVRQASRGRVWQVVEDASSGRFFRMNEPAWRFVGLLNGRRTVGEAWEACQRALGDAAPTQGEAIHLLGQLYSSDLIQAELPGDAEALLRRRKRRVALETRSYLLNLLFLRIPLWNPDAFLARWTPLVAWLFTPLGLVLWLALLAVGAGHLAGRGGELMSGLDGALAPDNLIFLYLTYAAVKSLHELGHGFACKAFGLRGGDGSGSAGSVPAMGVMFLVFMPVLYVDASSSWLFRRRSRRVAVAAAGIAVELALAAIAAIVWARTAPGTLVHSLAWNTIFLAGVSTLIFNGNPLMRYDGYYILSDLIEIPNLARRSQEYAHYLVKRYVWGVRRALNPADTPGERGWFVFYYFASGIYRVVVYAAIVLFILDQRFVLGALVLAFIGVTWLALPVGRLVRYVAASPELSRVRARAGWSSAATAAVAASAAGLVPLPRHVRAEGVIEPAAFVNVHADVDARIVHIADTGSPVSPAGPPIVVAESPSLLAQRRIVAAELSRLSAARRAALGEDPAEVRRIDEQIAAVEDQRRWIEELIAGLSVAATMEGVWIAPAIGRQPGTYMRRGELLGMVADLSGLVVRASADQGAAAAIIAEADPRVELRARSSPGRTIAGTVERILPAGYEAQAPVPRGDSGGPLEPLFEVRIRVDESVALLPGQRVIARFRLPSRPLVAQAWHAAAQVLQRRFRI